MIDIISILGGIVTIIMGIIAFLVWSKNKWVDHALSTIQPSRKIPDNFLRKHIIKKLIIDQATVKPFRGQFGNSSNHAYEKESVSNNEVIEEKPRMYLTYWPTLIFVELNIRKGNLKLVKVGLSDLFTGNKINTTKKINDEAHRALHVPSHRHTLLGAAIEIDLSGTITLRSREILSEVFQSQNEWRDTETGAWYEIPGDKIPDLFTTMYAVNLLERLAKDSNCSDQPSELLKWINEGLDYLKIYCDNMISNQTLRYEEMVIIIACQIGAIEFEGKSFTTEILT